MMPTWTSFFKLINCTVFIHLNSSAVIFCELYFKLTKGMAHCCSDLRNKGESKDLTQCLAICLAEKIFTYEEGFALKFASTEKFPGCQLKLSNGDKCMRIFSFF